MWTASPKINNDTINNYIDCYDGSPLISNNNISDANAIDIGRGSPIISNNIITSTNAFDGSNAINAQEWGSPIVTNNTIVSVTDWALEFILQLMVDEIKDLTIQLAVFKRVS